MTINGTNGNDYREGTGLADRIRGLGGDDMLRGLGGNDTIFGGLGADTLDGGQGNDRLLGDTTGTPFGGPDDIVTSEFDVTGNSVLIGDNILPITPVAITPGIIWFQAGELSLLAPPPPRIPRPPRPVQQAVDATSPQFFTNTPNDDVIRGGEGDDTILGELGLDSLFGDSGDDSISGGIGDDSIFGGLNDDTLAGDGGNDTVSGDQGDDNISGVSGDDSLLGGILVDGESFGDGKSDTFRFVGDEFGGSFGNDTITGFEQGLDKIEFGFDILLNLNYDPRNPNQELTLKNFELFDVNPDGVLNELDGPFVTEEPNGNIILNLPESGQFSIGGQVVGTIEYLGDFVSFDGGSILIQSGFDSAPLDQSNFIFLS